VGLLKKIIIYASTEKFLIRGKFEFNCSKYRRLNCDYLYLYVIRVYKLVYKNLNYCTLIETYIAIIKFFDSVLNLMSCSRFKMEESYFSKPCTVKTFIAFFSCEKYVTRGSSKIITTIVCSFRRDG
jgi:hypothetical protein